MAYQFQYDDLIGKSNQGDKETQAKANDYHKVSEGTVKTLALRYFNKEIHFQSYAFLVRGNFAEAGEQHVIALHYTDGTRLTLTGYHLYPLFDPIQQHKVVFIRQIDPDYFDRYRETDDAIISLMESKEPLLTSIEVRVKD